MSESIKLLKQQEQTTSVQTQDESDWFGGAVLVGLGIFFLLGNVIGFPAVGWWGLFLLIPAAKHWPHAATSRDALVKALIWTILAVAVLLQLSFSVFVPAGLILLGAALVLDGMRN